MSRGVGLNHSARARGGGRETRSAARPEPPPTAPRAPPLARHAPLDSPASDRRTHVARKGERASSVALGRPRKPERGTRGNPAEESERASEREGGREGGQQGRKFKYQLHRLAFFFLPFSFSCYYLSFLFSLFLFSVFRDRVSL